MRYLLDTNVVVDYFTGRYPSVIARLLETSPEELAVSSIAVAELRFGADKSTRSAENHDRIDRFVEHVPSLDFDLRAAACYGRLR